MNASTTMSRESGRSVSSAMSFGRAWAWGGAVAVVFGIFATWAVQFSLSMDEYNAGGQVLLDKLGSGNNEALWRVSSGIGYLAVASLVWFAAGFRRMLEERDGGETVLPAVIFGSMLVTAASLAIAMSFRAQVFDGFDAYAADPSAHVTINRLSQDTVLTAWAGLLGAAVAAAIGGIRGALFPRWFGWYSAVLALAMAVLCLAGVAFPANVPAFIWLLGAVVWAIRASGASAADAS
ncbi:hypothetical protein AYO38_03235 [bacterium SCGC AG-212-C10]|nr:hypothetical protein AYO38_03235 [bacterium SCGC AG-212-C10]